MSILASLVVSGLAAAWQPDYILRVTQGTIYSDCTPRWSTLVNGTTPGPLIRFTEGEHYWVRVYNDMPNTNTTIHWHGFTQYMSPFSDGTPMGSGWPIPSGHFYDYEFKLEPGFVGTYWYHPHVGMQDMTAGGPIIVDPAPGMDDCPVQYDEDLVMLTNDYYHATEEKMTELLLNETQFTWVGDPQSLLVNGQAHGVCNASALAVNQTCPDPSVCGTPQFFVRPNTRYRVRVVATGALSYLQMALEGHNMTVFEVDGTYINPIPIGDLQIQIGQRYSVLIHTMANPPKKDYYWRRRTMWRPTRSTGAALWTYKDDVYAPPVQVHKSNQTVPADLNTTVFLPNETYGWIDSSFVMHNQSEYPPTDSEVTKTIFLTNQQIKWGPTGKALRWAVNNRLYDGKVKTEIPILVSLYEKTPFTGPQLYRGEDERRVLDIVIQMIPGQTTNLVEAHPWHSHGKKYWDMGIGMGNFSYEALSASLANRTGKPYLRDTSVAYSGPGASYLNQTLPAGTPSGWRLFRIRVTDPGLWLIHCHITMHQLMGMTVPLLYGGEDLPPIPQSLTHEYLTFGGGAFGNTTYDSWNASAEMAGYEPVSYFKTIGKL